MYLLGGEKWPRLDPITRRNVCHACWNMDHKHCGLMFTENAKLKCEHWYKGISCSCKWECDCVHIADKKCAEEKRESLAESRKQDALRMKAELEDEHNPMRAVNEPKRVML
jgi:hypothetical protein